MASSLDAIKVEKGKFKMSISKISCLKLADNDRVRHSGLRELGALSSKSSGMRKAKV
jgi:hypothetical protein